MSEAHIPRRAKRILLVDDHAAILDELALALTEHGVGDCRGAAGCDEALDRRARAAGC